MVEVVVSDNGPGIPDDMKPAIFDRFKKGKSTKTGKGLGLFISRMLVEIYGGKIWAEDRVPGHPGQGAAIHFTLRKATQPAGAK
jgi:signal transduction histidine kinase